MVKVRIVLISSTAIMLLTILISYFIESSSQKLPAVVEVDKVLVSTTVSGIVKEFTVDYMQVVKQGDNIVKLENSNLAQKLNNLHILHDNYAALVESETDGELKELELNKIDKDLQKNRLDLAESEYKLVNITARLKELSIIYPSEKQKNDTVNRLFSKGSISSDDYQQQQIEFEKFSSKFNLAKSESLIVAKKIDVNRLSIAGLEAKKDFTSNRSSVLQSKNQLKLLEITSEISELEQDNRNLLITAPIDGVISDLRAKVGEKAGNGTVVVEIANLDDIWLTAYCNSAVSKKFAIGNEVTIYANNNRKIQGKVVSIAPIMDKVKSLSTSFETTSTYTKIDIAFEDNSYALEHVSPGERLFVRVKYLN